MERKRKREQRKLEREQRKQEKLAKKEAKPEKKAKHEKKSKSTKKDKVKKNGSDKKEERNLKKEHRAVKREIKNEQRAENKKARKEKSRLEKLNKAENKKNKKFEEENKSKSKKEHNRLKKQQKKEAHHIALLNEQKESSAKLVRIDAEKAENLKLAQNWKTVRASSVESDYKNGKYSDLYMLPAWPVTNWFYKDKALINATAFYHYATEAYDSEGASRDLTTLFFGEKPIYLHDIVLASKLLEEGKVGFHDPSVFSTVNQLLQYWGGQEVKFNGRTEQYGLSLDFMRHVLRDDISVGIQIPMMFMKNHLQLNMDFPTDLGDYSEADSYNNTNMGEFASLDYKEALRRIFRAKGIDHLGGSASGLGDITLFGNVEVTTKWVEKIVAGLKFVLPTGRKAGTHKLWAPEIGNGGCTEVAAFISFLLKYKPYINPHLFLQAGFNIPAHVNKRVPNFVESGPDVSSGTVLELDLMSLADRFIYRGIAFAEWDTAVRGFGDKPVSVKFEKGPEITARLGNVFEKFLSRRGFMDIFYNLRVKFEDSYRQVNRDAYKIDMLEDNTKQVEHRVGLEYSLQFDSSTRMKAGMIYTFAGINVPKSFDIGISFAHSF